MNQETKDIIAKMQNILDMCEGVGDGVPLWATKAAGNMTIGEMRELVNGFECGMTALDQYDQIICGVD